MVKLTFPFTKKDKSLYLPVQMAVYVPSTKEEKSISTKQFKKRIKETVMWLNQAFGGTTRVRGMGSWYDTKSQLGFVEEKPILMAFLNQIGRVFSRNQSKEMT